ncbi:MAG: lipid-A-disaccharide synthase N-terminal domain-containing protein [Gemmatimonadales bacterium]
MNRALWLGIGFLGQTTFSLRFLVQWWRSERAGRSVVPLAFWYLSLVGGVLLLFYAVYRRDPVFILGQVTGVFVYLRNLHLIRRAGGAET